MSPDPSRMLEGGTGGRSVSYEVYLLIGGRWELHARHGSDAREDAIDEARQLERESRVEASCVTREAYDAIANSSTESVVYRTPKLKKSLPVYGGESSKSSPVDSGGFGGGGNGMDVDAELPSWMEDDLGAEIDPELQKKPPRKRKKKRRKKTAAKQSANKPVTMLQALPRLLGIFLISCLGGGLVLYVALFSISYVGDQGIAISRGVAQTLLIGGFFVGFLMFCVTMLRRFAPDITGQARAKRPQAPQPQPVAMAPPQPEPVPVEPFPEPEEFPEPEPEPDPEPECPTVDEEETTQPEEDASGWEQEPEAEAEVAGVPEFNSP